VRSLVPDAPGDLADLCADLLRADPRERPGADAIRARLGVPASGVASAAAVAHEAIGPFVGREREIAALERAFADVGERRQRRIVVLEGEPGVGKSALVHRFLGAIDERALVLVGRCYEQETMPLKGIDGLVDSLSEHLLAQDDDELRALLAGGVRYLAAVFPVLRRISPIANAVGGTDRVDNEAALRDLAFGELGRLVDAIASRAPLVLFVDDVQWADDDSLTLLDRLLHAPERAPYLFVATMRAGSDAARERSALLAGAERIALRGLGEREARVLWDALLPADAASHETRAWAMREAAGHPLFLAELARSARAGALGERPIAAALPDVLWRRVQARDPIEQRFLEMVALAGAPTRYEILAAAANVDRGECLTRLGTLRAAQLVRITRRGDERLVEPYHDRVREAIAGRVASQGARALAERHSRLGRALRDATRGEASHAPVFAIVQHLLAELHLLASRKARLATAYDRARVHAAEGLALLGPDGWRSRYALARDLSIARMEAEYLAGSRDEARRVFDGARARVTSAEDRAALAIAWIALETGHGRHAEAVAAGREVLRELGSSVPARVSLVHVLAQHVANRIARRGRSVEDLVQLEPLADPALASVLRVLVSLAPAAFFLDTNLVTWILLRIVGLTIEHGACDASSYGFVGYGSVLAGAFHEHAEGYAFGRAALALNARFENHALAARVENVLGGYIAHWARPFEESVALLRSACELANKHGDTAYESYSATVLSLVTFSASPDLASMQATAEWAREVGERRGERDMATQADVRARYAMALRGLTPDPRDLGTEGASDAELRASIDEERMPTSIFHYHFCRAELAYLFGDLPRAHASLREAARWKQVTFSVPASVELVFLEALVAAARFDEASFVARPQLLASVSVRVRRLAVWAASSPSNYEPYHRVAHAELARLLGRSREASARYEAAIAAAQAHRSPKREALALDLAARHARRTGEAARAEALARAAREAFVRWGAVARGAVDATS
jgi:predicted ATPase